jgi:hypothetical protein
MSYTCTAMVIWKLETGFGCHYSSAPGSCGSLGAEAIDFSVCTCKNSGYIKPNAMVGKSGYEWKTMDT